MKNLFYKNFFSLTPFAILILLANIDMTQQVSIEGHWVYESMDEVGYEYVRDARFTKSQPGVAFLSDGKLIKRQNSGWCGTPPISYSNYDGSWEWLDDKTISMTYPFWGGTIQEQWEILEMNNKTLKINIVEHEVIKEKYPRG